MSLECALFKLVMPASSQSELGQTGVVLGPRAQRPVKAAVPLDDGHIVEDGNHADLVAKGGYYSALYRQWTAGREVRSA